MCTGKCSKCIGITLFPLAACAIVCNILLYFPNGQVLQLSEITDLVWFFHGILGAGILVILPAFMMLGAGGAGCCANRCGMLLSVVLAVLGFAGGAYCVVISSLGLIGGPLCDTGDGEYLYPFRNNTLDHKWTRWLHMWHMHEEKKDKYFWNVNDLQDKH
ncbi:transmembrane 4 L6 family member 1-like isoform X2 [Lathamus discolor]|uniref:transmembrane 4 L6 family member 1-like isoform X2 n=1 Tax=Lathamus discolor TaxID=678569 RepID=UPI0032B7BE1D